MRKISILILIVPLLMSCSGNPQPEEAPAPQKARDTQVFIGLASFYSTELAGNKTASGDVYDPTQMTAAHRTLPFGTRVLVTNLENNKTVMVTVTDRGPARPDRLLEVSFAAARELNMLSAGVVRVRVEVINE